MSSKIYYYHWVMIKDLKYYLGYDVFLGYESLYPEIDKKRATKFTTKDPLDLNYWVSSELIQKRGVEEVDESRS